MTTPLMYWLLKSEPDEFSIDDLARQRIAPWTGVRNFQARNYLRRMSVGDEAFFYHSSCPEPGVVGTMKVVRQAYPDPEQFDRHSGYYDRKATKEKPIWSCVDMKFQSRLRVVPLSDLRRTAQLEGFLLLRPGSRLSVLPVSADHWQRILKMAGT